MPYQCQILLDSINTAGDRLTTFQITYPRFVHCELMTHRVFSRNSSSSRAIPIEKMIEQVQNDPVIPIYWGKNQRGMQAKEELIGVQKEYAIQEWLQARDDAVHHAAEMINVTDTHKQIVNRLLEPWMWITVIVSATEYNNFFNLRCHKDAQPEMAKIAWMMLEEYRRSIPSEMMNGSWHLPLLFQDTQDTLVLRYYTIRDLKKISTGRIARTSYLTHDGKRDPQADIDLHDNRLLHPSNPNDPDHMSPFEHVAMASPGERSGNFTGWHQYRKDFPNENRTTLREELR